MAHKTGHKRCGAAVKHLKKARNLKHENYFTTYILKQFSNAILEQKTEKKCNLGKLHNSPGKRECYFQEEHPLKLHKNYSQANCIMECTTQYARDQMESKCTPWYYPGTSFSLTNVKVTSASVLAKRGCVL